MARGSAPAPLVAASAVAVSVALLLLPLPIKRAIASALEPILFYPATRATAFIESILTLSNENRLLRLELATRTSLEARVLALEEENARLRRMVQMREALPYRLIPGVVLSLPGRFAGEFAAVDVGSREGVAVGLTVICPDGLVGRVVDVRPHRSLVRTLLSPESRVSVTVPRSGACGILRAERGAGFIVPDIPLVDDVVPGDTLVTSGLGGVFPQGFRVGIVTHVDDDHRLQLHRARAISTVRFHSLREVFVVGDTPPDTSWSSSVHVRR